MSAGQDFSSTYLQAQQQQTQRALAIADQIWQQKKLDLDAAHQQMMEQAQEWAKDPSNPVNQYHAQQTKESQGRETDRQADNQRMQQQSAMQQFEALQKGGATNGQVVGLLPPEFRDPFVQGGVAQMNAGGPKVPAQPGQTFPDDPRMSPGPNIAPQGQVGPQGPPPGAMMAGGVAGAGMQEMPPQMAQPAGPPPRPFPQLGLEGTPAVPFGADDFMQQQSPGFMQAQQKAQSGMANQQSMMANRDSMMGNRDIRTQAQLDRDAVHKTISELRVPILRSQAEKLAIIVDDLPDELESKKIYRDGILTNAKINQAAEQNRLGVAQGNLAQRQKEFAARNSFEAMRNLTTLRKEADKADLSVASANQQLARLKGQRDKLMKDPNIENDPSLQMQASDIQNQAQAVEQKLMIYKQNSQVAAKLKKDVEDSMVKEGLLKGPATMTKQEPVTVRRIVPPKQDLSKIPTANLLQMLGQMAPAK